MNTIGIIGTGNAAIFFAKRLTHLGFDVKIIWGRSIDKARAIATKVNAIFTDNTELFNNQKVDLILLCVKDDAIANIATWVRSKAVVAHCSGGLSIHVLKNCSNHTAVVYPLFTIKSKTNFRKKDIPFLWETNDASTLKKIEHLLAIISSHSRQADSNQRLQYHIAAVFCNNFTNHLLGVSFEWLHKNNLPKDMLLPLLVATYSDCIKNNPYEIQTGPAYRNDTLTTEKHSIELKKVPGFLELYQTISRSILQQRSSEI